MLAQTGVAVSSGAAMYYHGMNWYTWHMLLAQANRQEET